LMSGSCNAVKRDADGRLVGDMFDGEGFVRGMLRKGRDAKGLRALVVGAGGVGSGIAAALAQAGAAEIGLFDARADAAEQLAGRLRRHCPGIGISTGSNDPAGWDVIVNATPLGMNAGDPMPVDATRIDPAAFVGEVVMKQAETPFLAAARERGCMTQIGADMLFEQIPAYLEFFGFPAATSDELRRISRLQYKRPAAAREPHLHGAAARPLPVSSHAVDFRPHVDKVFMQLSLQAPVVQSC
ncbi:MAG: hypothetical protein KI789_15645, partial [Hoeflea sp.]|nr:hypothetical protein [Hoeflea sp.]